MKAAFIFPGQGAQKIGMGKDFYETFEVSKAVYDQASSWLGMDVCELCFEENHRLDITRYTQVGLLTTELAILKAVEEKQIGSCVPMVLLLLAEIVRPMRFLKVEKSLVMNFLLR